MMPAGRADIGPGLPLDAIGMPLAVFETDGRLRAANALFADLAGLADGQAGATAGMTPLLHAPGPDGQPEDLFILLAAAPLPATGFAALTRATDGRVLDISYSASRWAAGDGRPDALVLTAADVTEEKCLACKIKESRDKFRRAFDEQTELVCRFGPDTTIAFVNEAYAAALGRTPADLIGARLTDLMAPADARRFVAYLASFTPQDCIRDGEESFELPGGQRAVQWWRRRAVFGHDGRLSVFQSVGRDVTARHRRLSEREALERMITASPVIGARVAWAPGWPVRFVTASVARLGVDAEALIAGAVPLSTLVHPADRRSLLRALRTHARVGGSAGSDDEVWCRLTVRLRRQDGDGETWHWSDASLRIERGAGGTPLAVEAVLADVSGLVEQRARAEASEARLRDFAEAANDWFWEMGPDLRFTWVSDRARTLYGLDLSHVIGRTRWDIARIEDDPAQWARHRADLEARRPFRDFRFTAFTADGRRRRISVSGRPVFAAGGDFLGYRGSSTDVTDLEGTEAALAESSRRLRTLFDATDVALWDTDMSGLFARFKALRAEGVGDLRAWMDGRPERVLDLLNGVRVREVNRAAYDLLGTAQRADLIGIIRASAHIGGLLPDAMEQMWHGTDLVRSEGRLYTSRGTPLEVMISLRTPRTAEEARHVAVSLLDITDRVRTEQALRVSEQRFRRVFDDTAVGMALIDPRGRWLRVNDALCQLLRRDADALIHEPVAEVLHLADRPLMVAWMEQALAGGAAVLDHEGRLLRPGGGASWVQVTAVLLRDDGGQPQTFLAQIQDIDARKRAEARAHQAERQLASAVAAMSDGFVLFDADDRLVTCNARFQEIYDRLGGVIVPGISYHTLLREGVARGQFILPDDDAAGFVARALAEHRDGCQGAEQQLAGGRWIRLSDYRIADGSRVGLRTDVTEQKAREEALRQAMEEARMADRAKTEFLANMSHELRTPLNAIIGFSEILTNQLFGPLGDGRYVGYAADIHDSGRHLLHVIGDILDLSKIEAGEMTLEPEPLDSAMLAEQTLRMIQPRAEARGVRLRNLVGAGGPTVHADPLRLKQVLLNLLSNAVKFTPMGSEVRLSCRLAADGWVTLVVEDDGIGMDAAEIAIARSVFGQVQSAFSRESAGTGLGLPIAIKLVAAHGGRLDIVSAKGRGTRVTVSLPPG